MLVLGVETSCDETALALVEDGVKVCASVVRSQVEEHARHGGVVPEIAARRHLETLLPALALCFEQAGCAPEEVDAIAVTDSPGLVPALVVGVASADALGLALDRPVYGVNHVEAHLVAPFLAVEEEPTWPNLGLVVSGGHTHLFRSLAADEHEVLGATLDDAAGEVFDKVARLLDLGYPGGPRIQAAAAGGGDPNAIPFKRPLLGPDSLDFSFSGLKTSVRHRGLEACGEGFRPREGLSREDVAASFQACVVDVLVRKVERALDRTGLDVVGVGGGVACNAPLRARLEELAARRGIRLLVPPLKFCVDNAAMIAAQGGLLLRAGRARPVAISPRGSWRRVDRAG